jgi:hypothetical protein
MIDAKQAVEIAKLQAAEMLGETSTSLEEIERANYNGHDVWSITLSLPLDPSRISPLTAPLVALAGGQIQYKRFLIDAETGEFVAMKLREVA